MKWAAIFLIGLAVAVLVFQHNAGILAELESGQLVYIAVCVVLAGLYISSMGSEYRGRGGTALRHVVYWIGAFLLLITGYAYREDLASVAMRVTGEIAPPGTALSVDGSGAGERAVRLRRRDSGTFTANGEVNGTAMSLVVDTGASTVVLKSADAERAGIDLTGLSFTVPVDTANGGTFAAAIRLRSVKIGPIELDGVEALVAKPGNLKENLLGMTFLKRLRSYEFTGDFLTLRG